MSQALLPICCFFQPLSFSLPLCLSNCFSVLPALETQMPTLNVAIEPPLQPLSEEQVGLASAITNDDVRLDIAVEGFWSSHNGAIFDVRFFNPFACAKSGSPRAAVYRRNDRAKIRAYEQRVLEMEHGSFTFLVLSERKSSNNRHSTYAAFQATFRFCRVCCQWSDIQTCLPLGEVSQKKKFSYCLTYSSENLHK